MGFEPQGQRTIATHPPYELRGVIRAGRARWTIRRHQSGRTFAVADVYDFAEWGHFTQALMDGADEIAAIRAMDERP